MSITKEVYDYCLTELDGSSVSTRYDKVNDTVKVVTDEGTYILKCTEFIPNEED